MKPAILSKTLGSLLLIFLASNLCSAAEQPVGRFVQLRGTTSVERQKATHPARVKEDILASDVIVTGSGSRAKLLFIDDSVLTMGESSKLVIREFIYAKGKEGKSVFNLLDGKMRSVVGKTKFEVQTPTAVAAARGTVIYFDVASASNQTKIICLEGNVEVRNVVPTVSGQQLLTPGTWVIVKANEPPPPPVPAPPIELERARGAINGDGGSSGGGSGGSGGSGGTGGSGGGFGNGGSPTGLQLPANPPIQQQPIVQPRTVNITIGIPGQ